MKTSPKPLYLLVENPRKSNNLGPILRCAAAYAVKQVIFVGYEKCSVEGSHGASKHLNIVAFPTFSGAVSYLRESCNVKCIIGITGAGNGDEFYEEKGVKLRDGEKGFKVLAPSGTDSHTQNQSCASDLTSFPIHIRPFHFPSSGSEILDGNFCFVVSKNGKGLSSSHVEVCDTFVHIPCVPIPNYEEQKKSDSLECKEKVVSMLPYRFVDVQSCLSIVFHHFTAWQKYDERSFQGFKFQVDEKHQKLLQQQKEKENNIKAERRRREKIEAGIAADNALNGAFLEFEAHDY